MITDPSHPSGSALRERMIEDMFVRGFTEDTRRDYIRCVKAFAAFIGRSLDAQLNPPRPRQRRMTVGLLVAPMTMTPLVFAAPSSSSSRRFTSEFI